MLYAMHSDAGLLPGSELAQDTKFQICCVHYKLLMGHDCLGLNADQLCLASLCLVLAASYTFLSLFLFLLNGRAAIVPA